MTKTRIVVDLDSVCADLCEGKWFPMYNDDYNDNLTMDKIASWDTHLYAVAGRAIYKYLDLPGFYRDLDLLPGCRETLQWAAKHFELAICTSRPAHAHEDTLAWIDEQLPMIDPGNVIFCHNKHWVDGDILIDDCPRHIQEWRGVPIVFGDYPYNQHLLEYAAAPNWVTVQILLAQLL